MKKSKRMQRKPVAPLKLVVFDEAHRLLGSSDYRSALHHAQFHVRRPSHGFVATQAVMKFNSGKRIRYLGAVRKADGTPLKPAPKKFLPAQVIRQMAAA